MSSSGRPGAAVRAPDDRTPGRRAPGARTSACRTFAAATSSVPSVRAWVHERLIEASVDPALQVQAELLVSELATNAVQHARGSRFLVWVRADGQVEAAVRDGDVTPPRPRRATTFDPGGRGLALVSALADAWGASPASGGKWVWFRLNPQG